MTPAGPPPAIRQRVCSFSAIGFQSNSTETKMKANMSENAQDRAAFTYNAAADFFDASPLGLLGLFRTSDDRTGFTADWLASARCLLWDWSFRSANCGSSRTDGERHRS